MFTTKQKTLIAQKPASKTSVTKTVSNFKENGTLIESNPFIQFGMRNEVITRSGNGAVKLSTSGNEFVNQFSNLTRFRSPRSYSDISKDMETLWKIDSEMAVKFVIYIRMITRQVSLMDGSKTKTTQRGGGLKNEGIVRMIWIAVNASDVFVNNISTFISAGSWNDVIKMLSYDIQYNGWDNKVLDWDFMGKVILSGLENPNTTNLVRKYLPHIKTNSQCHTLESQADNVISKWICSLLFNNKVDETGNTYRLYRKLKSQGTAHQWQQLISKGQHDLVNFDTVAGRALSLMVSGKYLKNHNLEVKYNAWIENKPVAKFTGFPYELAELIIPGNKPYQNSTINAQFNQLVEVAKKGLAKSKLRVMSCLDVSGSMQSLVSLGEKQGKLSSLQMAKSSAIFFNEMIGKDNLFHDKYLYFSNSTSMGTFTGKNFIEKYTCNIPYYNGSTNIQSVFDFFVNFKISNPGVDENLIPNFIVCFSDGEFNPSSSNIGSNVEVGRAKLAKYYSQEFANNFGFCIVDIPNGYYGGRIKPVFETFANAKNTFYFSGLDLSPLGFLFGVESKIDQETGEIIVPKTAEELFLAAMDQELLNLVTI